jgi:ATP-dependent Zn protease
MSYAAGERTDTAMVNDELRGVAYHEAGHAVVALALDLRVARVEIINDSKGGTDVIDRHDDLQLEDQIALCFGGIAAEERFDAPTHEMSGFSDEACVLNLVSHVPEAERDALEARGYQRARDLLETYSHAVEDIAAQLLARRKIDLNGYLLKS